ncbi:MAG: flagellar protein FlaG [Deltaproteobacteria bacterium]|nr:flagellar protein FlaG [Deltaproteobacteria bacterium]
MNVEAMNIAGNTLPRLSDSAEKIDSDRKVKEDIPQETETDKNQIAPEELLKQIKNLTEEGLYSVRFERDETGDQLVVKIVDRDTDELIRQLPAEELLNIKVVLDDLRGNIVNTRS